MHKKISFNQLIWGFLICILFGPIFLLIPLIFDLDIYTANYHNNLINDSHRTPQDINHCNNANNTYRGFSVYEKIYWSKLLRQSFFPNLSALAVENWPTINFNNINSTNWGRIRAILLEYRELDLVRTPNLNRWINTYYPSLYIQGNLDINYPISDARTWYTDAILIYIIKQRMLWMEIYYIKVRLGLQEPLERDLNGLGPNLNIDNSIRHFPISILRREVSRSINMDLDNMSKSRIIRMIPEDIWNRYSY